jgi:hypothetical protein
MLSTALVEPWHTPAGRVSTVAMTTPRALICKVLFPSISTFETPPWQGWAFLVTFVCSTVLMTVSLARHDPKLLERRIRAGPQAEKEPAQKVIATLIMFLFAAMLGFAALDWRWQWSPVAPWVSLAGDALIVLSYLFFLWVFKD